MYLSLRECDFVRRCLAALAAAKGYHIQLKKAPVAVLTEEPKVALSLEASIRSKLVQTKQNVREMLEGKKGVHARVVMRLSTSEALDVSTLDAAGGTPTANEFGVLGSGSGREREREKR